MSEETPRNNPTFTYSYEPTRKIKKLFRQSLQINALGKWVDHQNWMSGNDEYSVSINTVLHELKQKLTVKYLAIKTREDREPLASEVMNAYLQSVNNTQSSSFI